jgi:hypothetical protein
MAFRTVSGYNNLPNGNFTPVIYSKKMELAYRKKSTISDVTNGDYFGEIAGFGDTVEIMKEPAITINTHARGSKVTPQDLDDEMFRLVIDQANNFAFKVDDIEEKHAHHNWAAVAQNRAGYDMSDQTDMEVLGYLAGYSQSSLQQAADTVNTSVSGTKAVDTAGSDELLTSMKLRKDSFGNITTTSAGDHSIPVAARLPGATALPTAYVSPVMVINRMAKKLTQQFVPSDGRWIVINSDFAEVLADEDSRFHNSDFGPNGSLRSGGVPMTICGFRVYVTENAPSVGSGSGTTGTANQNTNYGVLVAGHDASVAFAQQISKTESLRDTDGFADIVRGMQVYGRKIIKPEGIVTAKFNLA